MIHGKVTPADEAVIQIEVLGPSGLSHVVVAVIDTGFSDYLSLPLRIVDLLKLPFRETETYSLADDTDVELDVFACDVVWDGRVRRDFVVAADGDALVGMSRIRGHRLTIDALDGGSVTIVQIAP